MALKQIYFGTKEYQQMINLRNDLLRIPLGLSLSEKELEEERDNIMIGAFDDDELIGCCMLTPIDNQCVKLRQMAVLKNQQGKGIGESLIHFTENIARDKGYKVLLMHARDSAIGFYEKYGYKVKGDQFIEVNTVHHVMEKNL